MKTNKWQKHISSSKIHFNVMYLGEDMIDNVQ